MFWDKGDLIVNSFLKDVYPEEIIYDVGIINDILITSEAAIGIDNQEISHIGCDCSHLIHVANAAPGISTTLDIHYRCSADAWQRKERFDCGEAHAT